MIILNRDWRRILTKVITKPIKEIKLLRALQNLHQVKKASLCLSQHQKFNQDKVLTLMFHLLNQVHNLIL